MSVNLFRCLSSCRIILTSRGGEDNGLGGCKMRLEVEMETDQLPACLTEAAGAFSRPGVVSVDLYVSDQLRHS